MQFTSTVLHVRHFKMQISFKIMLQRRVFAHLPKLFDDSIYCPLVGRKVSEVNRHNQDIFFHNGAAHFTNIKMQPYDTMITSAIKYTVNESYHEANLELLCDIQVNDST